MRADCTVWPEPGSRLDHIRTVLDALDLAIDRSISAHEADVEDILLACKARVLVVQQHALEQERARAQGGQP